MKYMYLVILILSSLIAKAQRNGYYITAAGDTVPAFIHLKKDVFGPYSRVGVQQEVRISADSLQQPRVYKPGEIRSFFVNSPAGSFTYSSLPLEKDKWRFWNAVILTPKTSLYEYRTFRGTSHGGMGESISYTIVKGDTNYLYIYNRNQAKLKKRLKEFYKDDEAILKIIEPLFKEPGRVDRDLKLMFERIRSMA